ncbi:MAG: hypothetical protein QGG36_02355 [Pirellulaceae bacterium]|nr:hypothetical protein [Pirellulaceae bacterium]MDP7014621.1 hypothetical protein [Pirellulaceae bacterium]
MRSLVFGLALAMAAASAAPAIAGAGDRCGCAVKGDHCKSGGLRHCPRCTEPCYPTVSKGTETRYCFRVESKAICIPRITFPWQTAGKGGDGSHKAGGKGHGGHGKGRDCGCGGKGKGLRGDSGKNCAEPADCGRIKYVNVLVKHEYECSACKYTWDPNKGGKSDKGGNVKPQEAPVPQPPVVDARFRSPPPRQTEIRPHPLRSTSTLITPAPEVAVPHTKRAAARSSFARSRWSLESIERTPKSSTPEVAVPHTKRAAARSSFVRSRWSLESIERSPISSTPEPPQGLGGVSNRRVTRIRPAEFVR